MTEKIFTEGLNIKKQPTSFGDIIKLGIHIPNFVKWLQTHKSPDSEWLNVDILTSKGGKLYGQLNTYKSSNTDTVSFSPIEEELPF